MNQLKYMTSRGAAALAVASFVTFTAAVGGVSAQEAVEAIRPVEVQAVEVRGNDRVGEDVVLSTAGIRLGDQITFRNIQEAIRRLWATDQYEDVRVFAEELDPTDPESPVRVVIEVEEQPYVAYVEFRGLEHIRGRTVRDSVGLSGGQAYDPARIAETEWLVRELLAEQGIRLRGFRHELEPISGAEGEYRLVFDVDEGSRVTIASIVIEGNERFDDDEIEGAMSTKEEGFLWTRPGLYDDEALRADLRQSLPEFYGRHGYIDFQVLRDTLLVDPETGKARLEIEVEEGQQYRLVDFDIRGNRQFPSEDLRTYYESARGGLLASFGIGGVVGAEEGQVAAAEPVFNRARFDQATEDVSQLYRNRGYLYAQVTPFMERTETADGEPAVRVGWDITENDPAYINRVSIVGNTYTHEDVIRDRIFVLPGDVYSEDLLIQSYRSIMGLGFFETPMPTPQMDQLDNGDIDVTFEVKEKQTASVNFGTTIGGWGGLAGFLGFDHPNLFGQAKNGHLRWEFGRRYNNFSASYSDPAIQGSRISGSLSVFSTRQNRFFNFPEGQRRNTGASVRVGLPLPIDRRFSRLFIGYQLSRTSYENFGEAGDIFRLPPGILSTASLSLARNSLDSPLFPTVGTRQELRGEFSGGPLGGDGNFQKYTASGQWWAPIGQFGGGSPGVRPVRTTLGISAEAGAIFGDASNFPFEQFWMGGVQFGQGLRGYDETTITPRGYVPRNSSAVALSERLGKAYVLLSAEYAIRFNDNISVSAFADAGRLWSDPLEVNPTRLFRGAGLGVQLVTPFGPMGLDYGYGFDKTDPGWQLHFTFGQQGF